MTGQTGQTRPSVAARRCCRAGAFTALSMLFVAAGCEQTAPTQHREAPAHVVQSQTVQGENAEIAAVVSRTGDTVADTVTLTLWVTSPCVAPIDSPDGAGLAWPMLVGLMDQAALRNDDGRTNGEGVLIDGFEVAATEDLPARPAASAEVGKGSRWRVGRMWHLAPFLAGKREIPELAVSIPACDHGENAQGRVAVLRTRPMTIEVRSLIGGELKDADAEPALRGVLAGADGGRRSGVWIVAGGVLCAAAAVALQWRRLREWAWGRAASLKSPIEKVRERLASIRSDGSADGARAECAELMSILRGYLSDRVDPSLAAASEVELQTCIESSSLARAGWTGQLQSVLSRLGGVNYAGAPTTAAEALALRVEVGAALEAIDSAVEREAADANTAAEGGV